MNLGLKLSANPADGFTMGLRSAPLIAGDEASWISNVTMGDDQGSVGSCAFQTLAEWSGVMCGTQISNAEKTRAYLEDYLGGAPDEGADFRSAFVCARKLGWFPGRSMILTTQDFAKLKEQPLLVAMKVTDNFSVNAAGCMDHIADTGRVEGYHAMLLLAIGQITALGQAKWFYLKNWWRDSWGYKGMCIVREDVFLKLCTEVWFIK